MGTIHKFQRPPKNENQFKGYRPLGQPLKLVSPKRRLRSQQKALLAWALLIAAAAAIVALRALLTAIK